MKKKVIVVSIIVAIALVSIIGIFYFTNKNKIRPETVLSKYFLLIKKEDYEELYNLVKLPENYSKEDFIARNRNIYQGIDAENIDIEIKSIEKVKGNILISYVNKMKVKGKNVEFENKAYLSKGEDKEYKINWQSNLIFPELNNDYKVRVSRTQGERGKILDRKGNILAEGGVDNRIYPYKEIASHITGYIQGITAEELENMKDKGYTSTSIIGKTGVEKKYEERLRGKDGVEVYIEDDQGTNIKTIVKTDGENGEDIKLTIDMDIQSKIYEQLKNDEGFFVVMHPNTGEILALVSTPSYDPNKFINGMSNEEWNNLVNSEGNPLYTRFLEKWCPGSTFKPITGAIGLDSGKLSINDEFYYTGLAWQKELWGDHKVTTLTGYNGKKNLRNALIYSDNIYFAQAALKIGEKSFIEGLDKIKFNEEIGFDMSTAKSIYSNTDSITSESILADSGYGQGQILVNPIHMAAIYSAFANDGNMIKPYLEYKEDKTAEYLVENAFTKETANEIKECLIQVVENPSGTGHDVKVNGITIAGKTGTAELKASKEADGDTLGWFDCFTVDQEQNKSLLIISMAKNKKSTYLKAIIKTLFQ